LVSADLKAIIGARSVFDEAYFVRADLADANLSGKTFTNCNFDLADLERTDLTRAVFVNCRFRQASLYEVLSLGARFEGCDLRDVKVSPDFQRMVTMDEVSQDSFRRPEDWEWPAVKPGIVEITNVNITQTIEPDAER
jgi:uncharacterized protein YjbI with pentapeptide repeats